MYSNLGNAYVGLNKNEDACQVLDTSISLNGSSRKCFCLYWEMAKRVCSSIHGRFSISLQL